VGTREGVAAFALMHKPAFHYLSASSCVMTLKRTFHQLQEITPMAQHNLALKVSTELPVGSVDLELPVKRNGRRIGTFTVNAKGVSWNPATAKATTSVSWDDLPAALAGTPAAAASAPAPAKKASTTKAAPAKRATRKRSASQESAPQPAAEPAPVAEAAPAVTAEPQTAAPEVEPAATATPSAAETVTKTKTTKKAAAVNARAVREWAAGNGITIGPRGPIAVHILDQYRTATA